MTQPANPVAASGWSGSEGSAWRNFSVAMVVLAAALFLALFSAAVAQEGRVFLAGASACAALGLAGWVGVAIVPKLAKRTSLRWIAYQVDYRLTRDGIIYLGAVFILILAAVNTGNNLLFLILACLLGGILISGVLSRVVLTGIELKFDLPAHIFAGQPVIAEVELRNEKQTWPSFSLCVIGGAGKSSADILTRPVFFPYIPRRSAVRHKVELQFPRRGAYCQNSFGIRTRFPFGFFEKTRRIDSQTDIVVYPTVEPTEHFYEVLPLLSGEMASQFRGRGHELHSLRDYVHTDSARFVDWKVTARTGSLVVREFAREDERRVMLVLDPFSNATSAASAEPSSAGISEQFERAVSMASCIAWHFYELQSVLQFRTHRFSTPMAPAGEIIYDALRELALVEPSMGADDGGFLDGLGEDREVFKIIFTSRPQKSIPSALWSSSYFIFIDRL